MLFFFRQHTIFQALQDAPGCPSPVPGRSSGVCCLRSHSFVEGVPCRPSAISAPDCGCPCRLHASSCRCGRPLDILGHHRAACANAGVCVATVVWVLENVTARARHGKLGCRVRTSLDVRDVVWRSWSTGFPCGAGLSWQSTPPWCHNSHVIGSL